VLPTHTDQVYVQGPTRLQRRTLPLKRLLDGARAHGSSIGAVTYAAFCLAQLKHATNTQMAATINMSGLAVDLRDRVPDPRAFPQAATTSADVVLPAERLRAVQTAFESTAALPEDFWAICNDIKCMLQRGKDDDRMFKAGHEMVEATMAFVVEHPEQLVEARLWPSLLGKVDDFVRQEYAGPGGAIAVDDPFVTVQNGMKACIHQYGFT
jgi:hypothetical protein